MTAMLPLDVESARYQLGTRLGWPETQPGHRGGKENYTSIGTELRYLGHLFVISDELSQLLVNHSAIELFYWFNFKSLSKEYLHWC